MEASEGNQNDMSTESRELALPDTKALSSETSEVLTFAKEVVIADNEIYKVAAEFTIGLKGIQKRINETFDPIIKRMNEATKEARAQKERHAAPVAEAERILKDKIAAYQAESEKKRKADENRLRAEAEKQLVKDREAAAAQLKAEGRAEEAKQIIDTPVSPPVVIVQPTIPKVKGIQSRKTWDFRITDPGKLPREYLVPDEVKIRGVVRQLGNEAKIDGIEVYERTDIAAGGGR